jgi:hypothetical protein
MVREVSKGRSSQVRPGERTVGRVRRPFLSEMPCHKSLDAWSEQAVKHVMPSTRVKASRAGTETSAQERKEQLSLMA